MNFKGLVANGEEWDFKRREPFSGGSCPDSQQCPQTVTLCGRCVNYDVPGNIHYGWVGRAASFPRWVLCFAASLVQKGGVDDPKDQKAIELGLDLWDVPSKRKNFCTEFLNRVSSLNLQGTEGCIPCDTRYLSS